MQQFEAKLRKSGSPRAGLDTPKCLKLLAERMNDTQIMSIVEERCDNTFLIGFYVT